MADQQNISSILAALSASGGTPTPTSQQTGPGPNYSQTYQNPAPPMGSSQYPLPQPISSGSVDLSTIKPVSSGSVSIADAIAKARGFAAEKGVLRNNDTRRRSGRSRSPSRSPTRAVKNTFRDNYNPYRDERRGGHDRGFVRERTLSPPRAIDGYSMSNNRPYGTPDRNRGSVERGPAENDTERIPIEKAYVGLIIGRSGENLRRVEQTTGARVQFRDGPESGGSIRHCDVSGSPSARASAIAEILRIIDEHAQGNRGGPDRSRPQVRPESSLSQEEVENGTQIMVPDRTVGLIIGRGGETIRDLQERSGCHVNIVGENKSVSGLRPVNLIGSAQSQQMAKDLIMDIVESDSRNTASKQDSSRSMGRDDPYGGGADRITDKIMVPGDAVGMIIGKGGESIKEMQSTSGCKINVTQPSGRDIEREIGLVGTRQAIEMARRAIMEKVDAVDHRGRNQGRDARQDDPYRGADQSYSHQQQQQQQYSSGSSSAQHPGAAAPGGVDPYAAYGGYDNYVAMWYAAMAQQQQQGAGEQQPPGA